MDLQNMTNVSAIPVLSQLSWATQPTTQGSHYTTLSKLFTLFLQGNRYIAVAGGMWVKDTAKILYEEFKPQGYKVPVTVSPSIGIYMYSLFDSSVRMILPLLNKEVIYSNRKIKEDLGFDPIDPKTTVIDMAYSMIEQGFVRKTPKYLGPPEKRTQVTSSH